MCHRKGKGAVPACLLLGFWFLVQLYSAAFSLISRSEHYQGIAWWAHINGFIGGMVLLYLFKELVRKSRRFQLAQAFFAVSEGQGVLGRQVIKS